MEFVQDLVSYIWEKKKWFLIPVLVALILSSVLVIGMQGGSTVSQLIYAMF